MLTNLMCEKDAKRSRMSRPVVPASPSMNTVFMNGQDQGRLKMGV
jgi:hypothetical protein